MRFVYIFQEMYDLFWFVPQLFLYSGYIASQKDEQTKLKLFYFYFDQPIPCISNTEKNEKYITYNNKKIIKFK